MYNLFNYEIVLRLGSSSVSPLGSLHRSPFTYDCIVSVGERFNKRIERVYIGLELPLAHVLDRSMVTSVPQKSVLATGEGKSRTDRPLRISFYFPLFPYNERIDDNVQRQRGNRRRPLASRTRFNRHHVHPYENRSITSTAVLFPQ